MRIYKDLIKDDIVIRINIDEYNALFKQIRKYGYETVNGFLQNLIEPCNIKKVKENAKHNC